MKRHGADSHHKETRGSTLLYIPHSGKHTRILNISAPVAKLVSAFLIFAMIITALSLVMTYFIRENRMLNDRNEYIVNKYQEQISATNLYIARQSTMLEAKMKELSDIEFTQTSISGGILNLAEKLENVSTRYFSELPGSTSALIDYNNMDAFISDIKDITTALNEFDGLAELSSLEMVQFEDIRVNLSNYLEYVPSLWPTESTYIGSDFGMRWHPILKVLKEHTGIDLGGVYGDDIYAAGAGTVVFSGWNGGYGYMVKVDHGDGIETIYGHLSKMLVKKGDVVEKGQVIALLGSTGVSTGPHLHFEVRIDNVAVDPLPFIN
ncbi:MAG TPA: peptidoglycan DD-metalloendopeptidase family protein [Clostridia bacterium]|nr:peptidoglycan DD-metalloendopeptidase family protein [Clostridia bacterium]